MAATYATIVWLALRPLPRHTRSIKPAPVRVRLDARRGLQQPKRFARRTPVRHCPGLDDRQSARGPAPFAFSSSSQARVGSATDRGAPQLTRGLLEEARLSGGAALRVQGTPGAAFKIDCEDRRGFP